MVGHWCLSDRKPFSILKITLTDYIYQKQKEEVEDHPLRLVRNFQMSNIIIIMSCYKRRSPWRSPVTFLYCPSLVCSFRLQSDLYFPYITYSFYSFPYYWFSLWYNWSLRWFCAAIRRDSVCLWIFPFLNHIQVFVSGISPFHHLKYCWFNLLRLFSSYIDCLRYLLNA